jgi:hypothetical protein
MGNFVMNGPCCFVDLTHGCSVITIMVPINLNPIPPRAAFFLVNMEEVEGCPTFHAHIPTCPQREREDTTQFVLMMMPAGNLFV